MPIVADLGGKNYTLGRGRVYFDRFPLNEVVTAALQGEGERYLGNTPEFSTTSESEDLDHYSSEGGIRVKDDSVQLQLDRTGSMTCDNVDGENVAMYFSGDRSTVVQTAASGLLQVITGAKQGRFYQLGVSSSLPAGVRNVTVTAIGSGSGFSTPITFNSANLQVDEVRGRVYIPEGSAIDDEDIQITYSVAASEREQIVSKSTSIYGALRFVADNPKGENRDYYFPYVKLQPDGDYNLKGDEWQTMGFQFEVLKKASNIEALYIDGQPETA